MSKVSIIVPVYNVELYLEEMLDSVVAQTYRNLEIILVDDGSKDSSGKICDRYAEKDNRIVVIHQENAGAANAKNAGLDRATGEYITFADSDDIVEKDWIETMMDIITENDADMAECCFDRFYLDHTEQLDHLPGKMGQFTTEEYLQQYLERWTSSLFWLKLFKAELTKDIRFRKERRCIDDEFYTYKVVSSAKKIIRTDKVLYHYRQRKSSAVGSVKNKLQITDDAIELRLERYEWMKKRFPQLKKIYINDDINFLTYFSKNSVNDGATVRKFTKAGKYYFRESLKMCCDLQLLLNSIKFLCCRPDVNYSVKNEDNIDNYFE